VATNPVLDRPMLQLSDTDFLRFRDLIEGGALITGGLGSGKSSTSAKSLAMSFLEAGMGGLVLTVKSDETEHFIEYARQTGREKDVIIFNAESGLSFDPLYYVWNVPGRSAAHIETIVELFTTLMSVGKVYSASSQERYFENAVQELIRAALVLLSNAGDPISILSIHQVITSLPTENGQLDNPDWIASSYSGKLVLKLRERRHTFTESQKSDLDIAMTFLFEKWPEEDPRTRSNVESTWSGMASKFTYDPFRSMFCSGRVDFSPEETTHGRRVVLADVPVLEYGRDASRLCQVLLKIVFQQAWLRHSFKPGCCHGAFLFQDEFALLMHRNENHFHMVCRGSAIAPVCIVQNILSIAAEEFGEQTPGSKTLGFLGLISVKIFHANNETQTNQYAADQIGKHWADIAGWSGSTGGAGTHQHTQAGVSGNKQYVHKYEPERFTQLLKPDSENPLSAAVVYASGRIFNATKTDRNPEGKNYISCVFSRE
jgi:hypothetical protein